MGKIYTKKYTWNENYCVEEIINVENELYAIDKYLREEILYFGKKLYSEQGSDD